MALDAGPDVVAHYEAQARHRAVAAIVEDLAHLVVRLALAEEVAGTDALEDAEALGDAAETITTEGRVSDAPAEADADSAFLGWHALGSIAPETIACAACGARYAGDGESAELPACPACGTPDTWEVAAGARVPRARRRDRRLRVARRAGGGRQAALRARARRSRRRFRRAAAAHAGGRGAPPPCRGRAPEGT
ncbi:MAG: hypothetical protein HYU51_18650 [Candidatus Rokubacteria bacterium]|nr:hypothetical protein [Candidatus Rokubacteria bacterium]